MMVLQHKHMKDTHVHTGSPQLKIRADEKHVIKDSF